MQEPQIADDELTLPKIRVGICAMDKKAKSRPMSAIVDRMLAFGEFEIFTFGDDCILTKPIQEWPACEGKLQSVRATVPTLRFDIPVLLWDPSLAGFTRTCAFGRNSC